MISSMQRASSVPSRLQNGRMSLLTAVLLLVPGSRHQSADIAMRPELWPKVLLLLALQAFPSTLQPGFHQDWAG